MVRGQHAEKSQNASSFVKNINAGHIQPKFFEGEQGAAAQTTPDETGFKIYGLPEADEQKKSTVYFDNEESSLSGDQKQKIIDFAAKNTGASKIYLYGYASEEGSEDKNLEIIADRLRAVQSELVLYTKKEVEIIPESRLSESRKSVNYGLHRAVELSTVPIKATHGKQNKDTLDCDQSQHDEIDEVRRVAQDHLRATIQKVNSYKSNPTANADIGNAIQLYFKSNDPDTVDKILEILSSIQSDLSYVDGDDKRRCATRLHNTCSTRWAFALHQEFVTFCPNFFDEDMPFQQRILLHEMGHYITADLDDRAYAFDRLFGTITTDEALKNTDSFAILISELNGVTNYGKRNTITDPIEDEFICAGDNLDVVRDLLGRAERWTGYLVSGVRNTYGDEVMREDADPYIRKYFGETGRMEVAGIWWRARELKKTFKTPFSLKCDECGTSQKVIWNGSHDLTICPDFFNLDKKTQVMELMAAITNEVTAIPEKHRLAYGELAWVYKNYYWRVPD